MGRKAVYIMLGLAVVLFGQMPAYGAEPSKITLKMVDTFKPDHFATRRYIELFKEIGRRSQGRLEIIRVGGPEMIPLKDQLTICGKGGIDVIFLQSHFYSGVVPEGMILGLPVVSWSFDNAAKFVNSVIDDLDKIYRKKTNVCVMPGAYGATGVYVFTRTKEVKSPDDLKGLKIRTMGGYEASVLEAFGAAPTFVAPAEIYTAAERGVINGATRMVQAAIEWKEYEIWKYFARTPLHLFIGGLVAINVDTFNKLPADLQKLIVDTCKDETPSIIKYHEDTEKEAIPLLTSKGVKMVDLAPGELKRWQSIPAPAAEKYYLKMASENGKALMEKLKAAAR
jgi:TRAP-type C4-dicarboxylate transport system substrate-binding protein